MNTFRVNLEKDARTLATFEVKRVGALLEIAIQGHTIRASFTVEPREARRIASVLCYAARDLPEK